MKLIEDFKRLAKAGYKTANIVLTMHVAYETEGTDGNPGMEVLS